MPTVDDTINSLEMPKIWLKGMVGTKTGETGICSVLNEKD